MIVYFILFIIFVGCYLFLGLAASLSLPNRNLGNDDTFIVFLLVWPYFVFFYAIPNGVRKVLAINWRSEINKLKELRSEND